MICKIVVGIDKSDLSLKALQQAILFARGYGAQLKLVSVLAGNEPDAPQVSAYFNGYPYPGMNTTMSESYQIAWEQFVNTSEAWLSQKVSEIKETYAETSGTILHGNPGAKLCDVAETWNRELSCNCLNFLFYVSACIKISS